MSRVTRQAASRLRTVAWFAAAVITSVLVVLPSTAASAKESAQLKPLGIGGSWHLLLNSEFTGHRLKPEIWRSGWFGSGITGPINPNELACYSSTSATLPGDGTLHLSVTAVPSQCGGKSRPYTGAILSTNPEDGRSSGGFQFRYGLLQARVYIPPAGRLIANWPVVMMLGQNWPEDGEDDVLEGVDGTICSRFHSLANVYTGSGGCLPGLRGGWHTVAVNWEPRSVTWFYDGREAFHIVKGVTTTPAYIVLAYSASSKDPSVARPGTMRVAYVRVWQRGILSSPATRQKTAATRGSPAPAG